MVLVLSTERTNWIVYFPTRSGITLSLEDTHYKKKKINKTLWNDKTQLYKDMALHLSNCFPILLWVLNSCQLYNIIGGILITSYNHSKCECLPVYIKLGHIILTVENCFIWQMLYAPEIETLFLFSLLGFPTLEGGDLQRAHKNTKLVNAWVDSLIMQLKS